MRDWEMMEYPPGRLWTLDILHRNNQPIGSASSQGFALQLLHRNEVDLLFNVALSSYIQGRVAAEGPERNPDRVHLVRLLGARTATLSHFSIITWRPQDRHCQHLAWYCLVPSFGIRMRIESSCA